MFNSRLGRWSSRALFAVAAVATTALPGVAATASAEACPDVEVVFARGTFEAPGLGVTGQSFTDALRARVGDRSVDQYAVNYPASLDFPRAADGIVDASNRIQDIAQRCPNTKIVLGGYSQGAAVAAYTTTDKIPDNYPLPNGITGPMPPSVASHVAAVVLFGKPSTGVLNLLDNTAPPITIGQRYTAKTIEQCIPADPVCSPDGTDRSVHNTYASNGMTDQAADFAASKLNLR